MSLKQNFMNWDNPGVALITGASSGIGASYARSLSAQGFETILVARRKERLEDLARELEHDTSNKSKVVIADLSKLDDIYSVAEKLKELNNFDVLVNNAGFGIRDYFENQPLNAIRDMMFVHNIAPVIFSRSVLPNMIKKNRGVIINVSSMAAFIPRPQNVMYGSTKNFLNRFSEELQLELHDTNLKIQALCPGYTHTEIHNGKYIKNFDYSSIPEEVWMSANEVVELSLSECQSKEVVFIPGDTNQKFFELYSNPELGKKTRENMIKARIIPRK